MPDVAELERRMRPGAWDTAGFLGADESLQAILVADAQVLAEAGMEAEALGDRLMSLLERAEAARSDVGRPLREDAFEVEILRQRGLITCPWAAEEFEPCSVGAGSRATADRFVVTRLSSGQRLEGFVIVAHLIRDHGFFGGPGTRFRIEPGDVLGVLAAPP